MTTTHSPSILLHQGDYRAEWYAQPGPGRDQCEAELLAAGHALPLPHRSAWAEFRRPAGSWFVAVRDCAGACRAGFALEVGRSRSLPGHFILRAERFGFTWPTEIREVCLNALSQIAIAHHRVLRVHVEVFQPDVESRDTLVTGLGARRFVPSDAPRRYPRTLVLDLRPEEDELLKSFDSSTRRLIRLIAKFPLVVRPVEDARWCGRMADLHQETMARTGGQARAMDWSRCVQFAQDHPDMARVVGLFRTDMAGSEALIAYASAYCHGNYAHYDAAGSTRQTDLKLSLGYPLIWDLLVWARRQKADWFDFGGVTTGRHGTADRLGGISDFKRNFSKSVVELGGEWVFEPRPTRARVAGLVSAGAAWWSRVRAARTAPAEAAAP